MCGLKFKIMVLINVKILDRDFNNGNIDFN